jgi:hypothetical protein
VSVTRVFRCGTAIAALAQRGNRAKIPAIL